MVRSTSRRAKRNKITASSGGQKELIRSPVTRTAVGYAAGDVPKNLRNNGKALVESCSSKKASQQCYVYGIGALALVAALLSAAIIDKIFPYPSHASCVVKWKFVDPCTHVMQRFRTQMINWFTCNTCGSRGRRCRYMLKRPKQKEYNIIKAKHYNMDYRTVQNIQITFETVNNSCIATGTSKSSEWFIIFDDGTNYCNLRNLVSCTGFNKHKGFLELTNDTVCTQYDMAIC